MGILAGADTMSDPSKKTGSMFEKLGQRITTLKGDITENIERRRQLYNNPTSDQVLFNARPTKSEEPLVIERKIVPSPSEPLQQQSSGRETTDCAELPIFVICFR